LVILKNLRNASTGLSMNGNIFDNFNGSSVRSFDKLRTGAEALEG
jgi:hypothetical protein